MMEAGRVIGTGTQNPSPGQRLARYVAGTYGRVFDVDLAERLLERLVPKGEDPDDYLDRLEQSGEDSAEHLELVSLVTVGETYFYREAAQFEVLERALPELFAERGRQLTIWCAGASTGEEAYSVAITALRTFGSAAASKIRIVATDLNPGYIERAERAVFQRRSFRADASSADPAARGPEQLAEYLAPSDDGITVCDAARQLVSFGVHNLVGDRPYEEVVGTSPDVILCRNVCLYFDRQTFRKVSLRLAQALADGGLLLLGAAETVLHDSGLVTLEKRGNTFVYVKPRGSAAPPAMPAPPAVRQAEFRRATGLLGKRPFHGGTGPLRPLPFREDVAEELPLEQGILGQAALLLDMGEYLKAGALCHMALEEDPFRPAAHFLLGLARRLMSSYQEAIHQFRAAAYLQQDDWLASFHLAETYRAVGNDEEALREYRSTLARMDAAVEEPAPALLGGFAPEYFRRASQRQVDRLARRQSDPGSSRDR